MNIDLLKIDSKAESIRIINFIKNTLKEQGFYNVIIGISGGIDSAVCLSLLEKSIPSKNIFAAHLYYFKSQIEIINPLLKKAHSASSGQANIPKENIYNISIKDSVDAFRNLLPLEGEKTNTFQVDQVRIGNIMVRVRMIILYDLAKKNNALVCGTENKSEFYLGYFTRFGDEASDFEPIRHLYKTQIYSLAKYLNVPQNIIDLPPTAGLWTGQTDEKEFGFSYKEADNVLYLYFEKKESLSQILARGFPNAEKIIGRASKNSFKHRLPYIITP